MCSSSNSEVEQLQQQLKVLQAQLQQAQKMTAVGELVSTTTHEFNNVLMTVINYAKMGLRHRDDATRDKALDKILSAANRAARITKSVLGMARNRRDALEATDLTALLEETLVLLEREMHKYRITVDKQWGDVPPALVNGNQIQQVLLNLLINARQAMPRGGTLMLSLAHDAEAKMVDLVVRDTGCGIPPDRLAQIFDPFYSTKNGPDESGKGGTGLGLAMCRDIIEAHRGRIRVESTVGKGTAFTLRLPVAEPVAAAATAPPASLGLPISQPAPPSR